MPETRGTGKSKEADDKADEAEEEAPEGVADRLTNVDPDPGQTTGQPPAPEGE